jgi:2,5-dihydroxypyridine 5,6-dioxygenase
MTEMQAVYRSLQINPAKMANLFRKQFELCNVKGGETIALVSDLGTRRPYIMAAFAAASDLGADIYEMCVNNLPTYTKVGVPTVGQCKGTIDALKAANLIVIFHPPVFSAWVKVVRQVGARVLMILDGPDDLEQLQSPPGLKEAVLHADEMLRNTKEVRVTSEAGTDLVYSCGEYPVMSQYGFAEFPGRFDHWGGGHVHTFPNEGTANGKVVIAPGDFVILPYCRYVADRVQLTIKNGFITNIEGELDAALMRDWLEDCREGEDDRDPYAISHLGWGLNTSARWYWAALNGDTPERSRAASRVFPGNFLFSTGPNTEGGGNRKTKGHYDVPMRNCTVALDGKTVIERGKVVDRGMQVSRQRH